jgi:hypothetical protein
MPDLELEPIEAVATARTARMAPPLVAPVEDRATTRFAPLAGFLSGPVFSRARDIIAANMTELLDRAEDPARMIRVIIVEMEETLVEVRATAARTIADMKEMGRSLMRLEKIEANWTDKAELALSKGRDDLARAALIERQQAADMADGLRAEIAGVDRQPDRERGRSRPGRRGTARQPRRGRVRALRTARAARRARRGNGRRARDERAEKPRAGNRWIAQQRESRRRA